MWELLDRCNAMLSKRGTELLCEVHEHFSMQKNLAERGFWVYDFALPMLTLQVRAAARYRQIELFLICRGGGFWMTDRTIPGVCRNFAAPHPTYS